MAISFASTTGAGSRCRRRATPPAASWWPRRPRSARPADRTGPRSGPGTNSVEYPRASMRRASSRHACPDGARDSWTPNRNGGTPPQSNPRARHGTSLGPEVVRCCGGDSPSHRAWAPGLLAVETGRTAARLARRSASSSGSTPSSRGSRRWSSPARPGISLRPSPRRLADGPSCCRPATVRSRSPSSAPTPSGTSSR